jgi:hypothetical protein
MELLLATALFLRTFPDARVSQEEGLCDQDMEAKMLVLVAPKGRRCLVEASREGWDTLQPTATICCTYSCLYVDLDRLTFYLLKKLIVEFKD